MPPKKKMAYLDTRRGRETKGTRSANLMCYLLRDITYNQLYAEPFSKNDDGELVTVEKLRTNALELPEDLCVDAKGYDCHIKETLAHADGVSGAFDKLHALLDAYPDDEATIYLGHLFWNKIEPSTDTKTYRGACTAIVKILDDVHTAGGKDYTHFCVPFVGIQKECAVLLTEFHMDDFLFHFGKQNIEYFYKSAGTFKERKAIVRAKEMGILSETLCDMPATADVGSGNGMICVDDVCVTSSNPDHFCSMVEHNGEWHCSLYSDQA